MFDTHCHIHGHEFDHDRDQLIAQIQEQQLKLVCIGTTLADSQKAVDYVQEYESMWATVGLHPHEVVSISDPAYLRQELKRLAKYSSVVGLGETGFDFYYNDKEVLYSWQRKLFQVHIELAQELHLPIIIHTRDAFPETYELLSQYRDLTVIYHCFTGSPYWVEQLLSLPHTSYFSFSGLITFRKKTENIQEAVKQVPEDRILAETDSPYLAPEPFRGRQNQPLYVQYVIEKIAFLWGYSRKDQEEIIDANAQRVFQISS